MTREERERYVVRDCDGTAIVKIAQKRQAFVRATQEARKRGYEIEVYDSMAEVAKVQLWTALPSGKVEQVEVRSIESEKRALQAGDAR